MALLALALGAGGCSAVGLAVGTGIDLAHRQPTVEVHADVLPASKQGTRVRLGIWSLFLPRP